MDGSNGGGSFLGGMPESPDAIPCGSVTFSKGELEMLESEALDEDLGMEIQSGSSLCPNGLDER